MYKYIELNGEKTHYRIYDNGQVMNETTGFYLKGTIRNGYKQFDIRWKNKKYCKSQHRLLGEYFIDNPLNLPLVAHKDGNRLNNKLDNLEWVENSTIFKSNLNLKDHNDYLDYDLSQEQWRTYRNSIYLVSNLGRIKNCKTDKILKGKITDSGYREYYLTFSNKKHSILGHKIVWETWVGDKQISINHINGNKLDNRLTNLENISQKENNLKAIYDTQIKKFKKTACYDNEGNLIQIFQNNATAARAMGVKPQSIQYAIKNGTRSCGYYWKNIEEV